MSEVGGFSFYIMFIAIIAISVVIHELLHGIGWAISSGEGWKVVRFNINAMMPSCACKVALKKEIVLNWSFGTFCNIGIRQHTVCFRISWHSIFAYSDG